MADDVQQTIDSSNLSIQYINNNYEINSRNDDDYRNVLRSFVLADISALSEKIKSFELSGQGECRIFQDAMKLEIETLKYLETEIIDDHNDDEGEEENNNRDDETLIEDYISVPGDSPFEVCLSISTSISSCSSILHKNKESETKEKLSYCRLFPWLLFKSKSPLSNNNKKKQHWLRSIQGPIRESSVMEMVFFKIDSV